MKKIYFIFLIMAQAGLSFADNPGFFEIRLVNPGGEPGVMRVQMRAISSVVPTSSDYCFDLGFSIWWDNVAHPLIADIKVTSSIGGLLTEAAPAPGNSSGSGAPNGLVCDVTPQFFFQFPATWIVNQWVNIATVSICSVANCASGGPPAGISAADFLVQGFTGILPDIQINGGLFYTPANGPLPLNLISFKAEKSGERNALLSWVTTNEENTSHFVVERSFDKKTWSTIGSVGAAGYSISIQQYSFTDVNVYNGRDSRLTAYYRLQMVDQDSRTKLSPVQSVVFGTGATVGREFVVYPNPTSDGLQVEWDANNADQPTTLEFYDVQGKLVYTRKVSDNTNQEYIDFGQTTIQPGLYLLRILNGNEPLDFKQIVVGNR